MSESDIMKSRKEFMARIMSRLPKVAARQEELRKRHIFREARRAYKTSQLNKKKANRIRIKQSQLIKRLSKKLKKQERRRNKELKKEQKLLKQQESLKKKQEKVAKKLKRDISKKVTDIDKIEREIRTLDSANDNVVLSKGETCNISDKVMGDVHFSKFPVVSVNPNENNCVYLSRVLGIQNEFIPVKFISSGSQNSVYKAVQIEISKKNGNNGVVVRVSRIGDSQNDVPELDFKYSSYIHNLSNERLTTKNISSPKIRMQGIQQIKSKLAGVQVMDFVQGASFGHHFMNSNNTRRDSLARKFGRTLGVMHRECNLSHGDANHGNFMIRDDNLNAHNLVALDLDRCVNLDNVSGREERTICRNYDLTQAFSTLFSLITDIVRSEKITGEDYTRYVHILEERFFSHFTKSYLSIFGQIDSKLKIWENIPRVNIRSQRERNNIVYREFQKYSNIWRRHVHN